MRAKTILTVLFLISLAVAVIVVLRAMPTHDVNANNNPPKDEVLVATVSLAAGTLLRAQDVTWQSVTRPAEPGEIFRPSAAARRVKPEIDEETRAEVYGAAVRPARDTAAGEPIRRGNIVKPGDRDFLQVVLTPGARAIAIPVSTSGASTGLLFPGDRVDVILTQNFKGESAVITRRSVSETVVENLRVLAIDTPDAKAQSGSFGRTVTLEVTPQQAEKVNVATELGKLSLTLRSVSGPDGVLITSTAGPGPTTGVKPTWAGDVSPALGGAMPEKTITVQQPPVEVVRGSKREAVKTE
ncbi:MAG: Flp pilus assembly protein CpaB [Alphaproteobacteria bacterium]|nr:Flp pilus assembly protein CpaB [Alphaproteobacteria bacterium]